MTTSPNAIHNASTAAQHHCNNNKTIMSSNQNYEYTGGEVSRDIKREVETVTIHTDVTAIEEHAFFDCINLTTVNIPTTASLTSIGNRAFFNCESLQSINIPSSVTTIGEHVFNDCSSLESITLPSSISIIPEDAFYWCEKLTTINLPNSIKSIESRVLKKKKV